MDCAPLASTHHHGPNIVGLTMSGRGEGRNVSFPRVERGVVPDFPRWSWGLEEGCCPTGWASTDWAWCAADCCGLNCGRQVPEISTIIEVNRKGKSFPCPRKFGPPEWWWGIRRGWVGGDGVHRIGSTHNNPSVCTWCAGAQGGMYRDNPGTTNKG